MSDSPVHWFWRSRSSRGSSSRVSSRDHDDDNNAATAATSREENSAAAALVLEQLDEQWFSDNVVRWPSSRPGSPPGVITKDIIASPFQLLPPSDVLTKPRRRVIGERATTTLVHPPRSRRLSDGDYHLRRNLERDAISRRQRLPEPEDLHRRNTDLSNSTSSLPKTPTHHDLNDQSRFCSEANTMDDVFSPLALPPSGPLVGVTEDEELENDLFAKMLANRPAKLTTINPGRLARGLLQENTSNSNSNSNNNGDAQKAKSQSRQRRRLKGTKSLTDLEYEELRGLKDLGFEVSKDDLTPHVVRMFPGLQRQGIPPYNSPNSLLQQQQQREQVGHTVLSQSRIPPVQHLLQWPRRPDSPLTNTPFLDPSIDMKGQLKSWASEMASIVSTEC